MTESEAAFAAAVSLLGRLRGARLCVDPDVTWMASGRPLASLNNVFAVALRGDPAAIDARIEAVQADVSDGGALPATWWIGPGTTPPDLAAHLRSHGLTEAEPEFGMVVDVDGLPAPAGDVEEVGEAGLDEWLGVMGRSYGWSDPRAIAAWSELYRDAFGDPEAPWWHVVVREWWCRRRLRVALPRRRDRLRDECRDRPRGPRRRPRDERDAGGPGDRPPPRLPAGRPSPHRSWAAGSTPGSGSARMPWLERFVSAGT